EHHHDHIQRRGDEQELVAVVRLHRGRGIRLRATYLLQAGATDDHAVWARRHGAPFAKRRESARPELQPGGWDLTGRGERERAELLLAHAHLPRAIAEKNEARPFDGRASFAVRTGLATALGMRPGC